MWRAGMLSSNFFLTLIGIILTIYCIITIPLLLFAIFSLDFKIYENGLGNPVPLIKKYRKKSFYPFDKIINMYTTNIHLIIETEERENPIALNLLGRDYNKILQIALEAKKRYHEKNRSRI